MFRETGDSMDATTASLSICCNPIEKSPQIYHQQADVLTTVLPRVLVMIPFSNIVYDTVVTKELRLE